MQELIKIQISKGGKQVVSARELHQFLGVKTNVNTWFKNQVERAMLQEGKDFIQTFEESTGGRPNQDYAITLSSCKEIAMLNGGDKGKQARLYFIECERQSKQPIQQIVTQPLPTDFISALEQLLISKKSELALEEKVKELEPLAKVAIRVLGSNSDMTTTTIAKELGLSAIQLNKILHDNNVQYFQDEHWVLYTKYKDKGYTKLHTFTKDNEDGTTTTRHSTKWTEKGRAFISDIVEKHFEKLDELTNQTYNLKSA